MSPRKDVDSYPMPNRAAYGTQFQLFTEHYELWMKKKAEMYASLEASKPKPKEKPQKTSKAPREENSEIKAKKLEAKRNKLRGKRRAYRKRKYLRELAEQAQIAKKVASIEASNQRIMAAQNRAAVTQQVQATAKGKNALVPVAVRYPQNSGWTTVTRKGKARAGAQLPPGLAPSSLGNSGHGTSVSSVPASQRSSATTVASSVPTSMLGLADPRLAKLDKESKRLRKERDYLKTMVT